MRFVATWPVSGMKTHERDAYKRAVVEAPTWMLAKNLMSLMHPSAVTVKATPLDDDAASIEIREVGDDYAHGGTLKGKRVEFRLKEQKGWSAWMTAPS